MYFNSRSTNFSPQSFWTSSFACGKSI